MTEALQQNATVPQAARQPGVSLSWLRYVMPRFGIQLTVTRPAEVRFRMK